MSQEKVAKYKEAKANRKAMIKKEKRVRFIRNTVTGLVCVAVLGWVGYSGVTYYIDNQPREALEADFKALDDYAASLSAEKTEESKKEDKEESKEETKEESKEETKAE